MIYRVMAWGDRLGAGLTQPSACTLAGIAKERSQEFPLLVLSELICSRAGGLLGLPVPPGLAVHGREGHSAFVSLRFGEHGELPPPANLPDLLADHAALASQVVVFDAWIGNEDRNEDNIAYARGLIPPIVFDHSHALFSRGSTAASIEDRAREALFDGELVAMVTDGRALLDFVGEIEALSPATIGRLCGQAAAETGVAADLGAAAARFLLHRRTILRETLRSNQARMSAIQQLGLL